MSDFYLRKRFFLKFFLERILMCGKCGSSNNLGGTAASVISSEILGLLHVQGVSFTYFFLQVADFVMGV